jgi:RecA/RadA recombinase
MRNAAAGPVLDASDQAPARTPPLTRAQANEVLRYWLASLQQEEALATRPKARRPPVGLPSLRLDAPNAGHDYFKLPLDGAFAGLVLEDKVLHKAFDAELSAFFETWLVGQYRRGEQDRDLSHLLAFPVVHLPRGELAGLLRCSLQVRFADAAGAPFHVPTRSQRRRKEFPSAPNEVRLSTRERGARQWPFFIDTRLLHQQLGVARENIDALFGALRSSESEVDAEQMLTLLCELLERELRETAPASERVAARSGSTAAPGALIERITAAVSGLLAQRGGRARVYPVGIVLDAARAKTTWYLQRELESLLEERAELAWDLSSCLGSYLTGAVQPPGMAVHRALFPGPALADSQRLAAERCAGSQLTAVQGPPGTGKTTLILHLAAEALVRQIDGLADRDAMGAGLLVVTSTNNRAVDNVVDPLLASQPGLPLALRAGSQKVCEQLLAPQLARARAWLESARQPSAAERAAQLTSALAHFKSVRAQLSEIHAPRALAFAAQTRRAELRAELARLEALHVDNASRGLAVLSPAAAEALRRPLAKLHKRLQRLCELCAATPGLSELSAVDRHHRASAKRDLPALENAIQAAGLSIELGLPPDLPASTDPAVLMEAWEVAADAALAEVEALTRRVETAASEAFRRERARSLRQQLAALEPTPPDSAPDVTDAELACALFDAAVAAREAWAAAHGDELCRLLDAAIHAARNDHSLRALWSDEPQQWQLLRQLFGIWGCTLLSLGNCFPAQRDAIERLVIDEAGQCHPTYAVSGLLRCRNALIIGDVHQLEPVIDLGPDDDARVIEACKLALPAAALEPYRVHSEARCSVQALADRAVLERPRLIDHFRCQPEIIAICDALCRYGLRVHTPRQSPAVQLPFLQHPVSLIDVNGEQERLGGSWHNAAELAVTVELFQALLHAGVEPHDVAVITPYRGQLEQLRKQFMRLGIPIDFSIEMLDFEEASVAAGRGAALGTVHRFQGGERSIVLFSSVVTRRASLGFLDQRENLLNVAISRARHRLIAIGQRGLLASGSRTSLLTRAAQPLAAEAFRQQLGLYA